MWLNIFSIVLHHFSGLSSLVVKIMLYLTRAKPHAHVVSQKIHKVNVLCTGDESSHYIT